MNSYYTFRNQLTLATLSATAVLCSFLLFSDKNNEAFSYASGSLTGVFNFMILSTGIAKMAKNRNQTSLFTNSGVRFAVIAVLVVFFAMKEWFHPISFFCGLFTIQGIIFLKVFFTASSES